MRGLYGGLIRTAPETALKACCTTGMGIDTSSLRPKKRINTTKIGGVGHVQPGVMFVLG